MSESGMGFWDWVFPRACGLCDRECSDAVCPECEPLLDWIHPPLCLKCGAPTPRPLERCRDCRGKPMQFDRAVALAGYGPRTRELVLAMKEPSGAPLAGYFARRLAAVLERDLYDLAVPVPLTRWAFAVRGYSAAAALAFELGRILRLPLAERALAKSRRTRPQKELPLELRTRNPCGAFEVRDREAVAGRRVLLVDDVLTTGATLSACAVPILRAGALSVTAAVVARG